MQTLKNCALCNTNYNDNTYQKRDAHDYQAFEPVYFVDKQFSPELEENVYFCSPKCSLDWYQQNKLKSTKN